MNPLVLLLLMRAVSDGFGAAAPPRAAAAAPKWPTTKSPPPLPAFKARKTKPPPSADQGKTSTPLAQLHAAPPVPPPASAIDTAKQKATAAIRKGSASLIRKHALSLNPFGGKKATPMSSALVSQLQGILVNHGAKLARDGLYGPKTASAWAALAKRKQLPAAITREGPKVAKVATQTFEALSVPPIP